MVMPTWLFGSCSVTTDSAAGITASLVTPGGGLTRDRLRAMGWRRRRRRWARARARARARTRARQPGGGARVGRDVVVDRRRGRARRVVTRQLGDARRVAKEPAVAGARDHSRRRPVPAVARHSPQRPGNEP